MLSSSFHPVLSSNASITLAAAEADSNQIFSLLVESSFCAQNSGKQRKGATSLSASLSIVDAECWENDALVYASSWCSRRCRGSVVGARDADENSVQASFIACHDIERSLSSIMILAGQRDCLSTTNFLRTWEGGREAQQCLTMLDLFCWDLSALE